MGCGWAEWKGVAWWAWRWAAVGPSGREWPDGPGHTGPREKRGELGRPKRKKKKKRKEEWAGLAGI